MERTTTGRDGPGGDVVVGVDGTATALRAVAWAAAEARARRAPLRIVHAAPYATGPAGQRHAAAILQRAAAMARQREPGVAARTERLAEDTVAALAAVSHEAQLLVVGMLSGHPGDELARSVAPAVVAAAECPVTVVRARHGVGGTGPRTVVVGVADVTADAPALDEAFTDADRHGCRLAVVHAVPGPKDPAHDPDAAAALHAALAPWRERHPAVPVDVHVEHGAPEAELLHASMRARNAVVGSRGRRAAAAALLGSTSRVLLSHGGCPVTVVRRHPAGDRPGTTPTAPAATAPVGRG